VGNSTFELVCVALRAGDCADDVKQTIANKIILLAKAGERRPDALCEQVLKDIRAQHAPQLWHRTVCCRVPSALGLRARSHRRHNEQTNRQALFCYRQP